MNDPTPPTFQIAEQIGRLIPLVNESPTQIRRPEHEPASTNLASHLTWDPDGELKID